MTAAGHSCRYCTDECEPAPAVEPAPAAVELPDVPRRFRVHFADHVQDFTLHPHGTITALMVGQVWTCGLSYEEMHTMGGWDAARIEWDPDDTAPTEPAADAGGPAAESPAVQTELFDGGGAR